MKTCSNGKKCKHPDGPVLPATADHFWRHNKAKDGFQSRCSVCMNWDRRKRALDPSLLRIPIVRDEHGGLRAVRYWEYIDGEPKPGLEVVGYGLKLLSSGGW